MSKEVILMTTISGLGSEGDVVKVTDGYARNYLLPKSLAAPVTEAAHRRLATKRAARIKNLAGKEEDARRMADKLAQVSLTIPVKAGPGGKLFGSVQTADLAEALKEQGFDLDRHQIELTEPIKEIGVFKAQVTLHPNIKVEIKVWVVEE